MGLVVVQPLAGTGWTGEVSRGEPHGALQREVQSPAPGEVPPGLSKAECCGQAQGGDHALQLSTRETHLEGPGRFWAPRKNWAGAPGAERW